MSTQDLNYEQPTVSDAAVDNSDDYTEYTFSTTKGMRFALIVTYIQYTILAKNDCMEVKTFPKKANKMPVVRYDDIATMHVKKSIYLVSYMLGNYMLLDYNFSVSVFTLRF